MSDQTIQVHIDLRGIGTPLFVVIQRSFDLVSLGIRASQELPERDLELPESFLQLIASSRARLTFDDARKEFRAWVIASGLRDCIEGIGLLFEEVRRVCALYSFGPRSRLTRATWQRAMVSDSKKFRNLNLPDKIHWLHKMYSLDLLTDNTSRLLTLNRARNCLVHRYGVVSDRDCNEAMHLAVEWEGIEFLVEGDDGLRSIALPGGVVKKGETLCMRPTKRRREFSIGERIDLTIEEFASLLWFFFKYGKLIPTVIEDYGRRCGFTISHNQTVNDKS